MISLLKLDIDIRITARVRFSKSRLWALCQALHARSYPYDTLDGRRGHLFCIKDKVFIDDSHTERDIEVEAQLISKYTNKLRETFPNNTVTVAIEIFWPTGD